MKIDTKKRVLTLLIGCNLALIWGNSLMTGTESGDLSGGIVAWLGQFLPFLATEAGHNLIRKAAHFSEFCLLGLLSGGRKKLNGGTLPAQFTEYGLAAACIDETIQVFVPGRGSSLIDVWIDTAGFATGLVLIALGYAITNRKKQGE